MFVQICLEEFSSLTFARLNRGHRAEPRLICTAGTTASRNEQVFQIRGEINREKKTLLDFRATVRRNAYRSDASRTLLYKVFLVFPLSSARVYVCVSVCVCVYVRARVQMRRSIETSNSRSIRSVLRRRGEVFFFFFLRENRRNRVRNWSTESFAVSPLSVSPRQGWWLCYYRANRAEEIRRQFN